MKKKFQDRKEKIEWLKAVKAGNIDLKAFENPLKDIDMNNLPCDTVADFGLLKKCHDYAQDFEHMEKDALLLFEALIKAGRNIGLVDAETETNWRNMRARSGKIFMLPVKASIWTTGKKIDVPEG